MADRAPYISSSSIYRFVAKDADFLLEAPVELLADSCPLKAQSCPLPPPLRDSTIFLCVFLLRLRDSTCFSVCVFFFAALKVRLPLTGGGFSLRLLKPHGRPREVL